jgi:hypothetical protein
MKKITTSLIITISILINGSGQQQFIRINNQDIFLNGMNLAWMSFANDLGNFDQAKFTKTVKEIRAAGGNTLRWWLHVNGTNSPIFTNGKVSGIKQTDLQYLKKALDLAYENGVYLDLCLWSFDMLQTDLSTEVINRNKALLTDSASTAAYINNALIPMVKYIGIHPGLLCWEVFNEPEGMTTEFGWTPTKVKMKYVQLLVNRVAGAIHREMPGVMVSSGAWEIQFCTDVDGFKNYYSKSRLVAQGQDTLGYLDFYMAHYYTSNGIKYSPFRKNAAHWKLDKPIAIGEFSAKGQPDEIPPMTPVGLYNCAYDSGYAGALSWTYTNHDGNGGLPDCDTALKDIETKHPEHVILQITGTFNFTPFLKKNIGAGSAFLGQTDTLTIGKFLDWFNDKEDSSLLSFKTDSIKNDIANIIITDDKYLKVKPKVGKAGVSVIWITATDTGGKSATAPFIFSIVDTMSDNRLQYRKTASSTIETSLYLSCYSNDSSETTRWSTEYKDDQWITFDLGTTFEIQRMLINWEAAFGLKYEVLVSTDNKNWQSIFIENNGDGAYDKIIFNPVQAKYLKLNCIKRGTQWGFSIFEIGAFSDLPLNHAPYIKSKVNLLEVRSGKVLRWSTKTNIADADLGEKFSISLSLPGNVTLPGWLINNDTIKVLTVTPTDVDTGLYKIVRKSTDLEGASVVDTIQLQVLPALDVQYITDDQRLFNLYPNPAKNLLKIACNPKYSGDGLISIVDYTGIVVLRKNIHFTNSAAYSELNIENIRSGIYIVRFQNNDVLYTKVLRVLK